MGGFGAFVARWMNPEAAENSSLRRWRRRADAVAEAESERRLQRGTVDQACGKGALESCVQDQETRDACAAKGLWSRVSRIKKRGTHAQAPGIRPKPSVRSYTGVEAQLMNPISGPAHQLYSLHEGLSALSGTFHPNDTSQYPLVDTYDAASITDLAREPLPVQCAREERHLTTVSSSSSKTNVDSGIARAVSLFPHHPHPHARTPAVDLISASRSPRLSQESTVVACSAASERSFDSHRELSESIERFRFTALVKSSTIDNIHDVRAVVGMTSSNLLDVGSDLQRLLVIWREITMNAPNVVVLGALEPWIRVSKEHVAKACKDMKRGLQSYRDWFDIMAHSKTIAQSQNAMSDMWWTTFSNKIRELELLETLDFDDATAQVELVMERYLGVSRKEVATPREPAEPTSMTNAASPTS